MTYTPQFFCFRSFHPHHPAKLSTQTLQSPAWLSTGSEPRNRHCCSPIFCMPPSLCSFPNFYGRKISTFPHTPKYRLRFFCIGDVSIYRFPKWARMTERNHQSSTFNLFMMSAWAAITANKRMPSRNNNFFSFIFIIQSVFFSNSR